MSDASDLARTVADLLEGTLPYPVAGGADSMADRFLESPTWAQTFPDTDQSSYICIAEDPENVLVERLGLTQAQADDLILNGFYKMVVTSFQERHVDTAAVRPVLGGAFAALAMGASPVAVTITGHLHRTPAADHALDFLTLYNGLFRGKRLEPLGLSLDFIIRNTMFRLYPQMVNVSIKDSDPEFVTVTITGVGSDYRDIGV